MFGGKQVLVCGYGEVQINNLFDHSQEAITWSLYTSCTLESAFPVSFISRTVMSAVGVLSFPVKTCWRRHDTLKRWINLPHVPPLLKYFCVACMWHITIEDHNSLMIGYTPLKNPHGSCFKIIRHGTGLTQSISMEDGSSGCWAPAILSSVLTLPWKVVLSCLGTQCLVSMIFTRLVKVAVLLSKAWVP